MTNRNDDLINPAGSATLAEALDYNAGTKGSVSGET